MLNESELAAYLLKNSLFPVVPDLIIPEEDKAKDFPYDVALINAQYGIVIKPSSDN